MPQKINVHAAKTQFSRLLARVELGEEIIISKAGTPVARLLPVKRALKRRTPGSAKGKIIIKNFDARLPASLMKAFEP